MVFAHDGIPNRCSTREAGHILHRFIICIAHPYADGQLGCKSHRPIIFEAIGRASFGRHFAIRQRELCIGAKGRRARYIIAHNIRHNVGDFSTEDTLGLRLLVRFDHLTIGVANL